MVDRAIITVALDGNPQDTVETGDFLVFRISDLTRFLSAIVSGAATSYPEAYEQLVQEAVPIMDICEQVADCIDTSPEVSTSLNNFLQNAGLLPVNGGDADNLLPLPAADSAEFVPETYDCIDPDIAFGMAKAVIDSFDAMMVQLFDVIDNADNPLDLFNALGDNVEGVSYVVAFTEFVSWIIESLETQYNAASSPASINALSCDLFCYITGTCSITIDSLTNFFLTNALDIIPNPPPENLGDLINYIITVVLDGELDVTILSVTYWFASQLMRYGGRFFGMPLGWLGFQQIVAIGASQPSSLWMSLCDECPVYLEATLAIDLSAHEGGFEPTILSETYTAGHWQEGTGWIGDYGTLGGNLGTRCFLNLVLSRCTIKGARMGYYFAPQPSAFTGRVAIDTAEPQPITNLIDEDNSYSGGGGVHSGDLIGMPRFPLNAVSYESTTFNTLSPGNYTNVIISAQITGIFDEEIYLALIELGWNPL